MLRNMTSRDWVELLILQKHELLGWDRQDFSMAKIAQAMAGGTLSEHMPPRMSPGEQEQTFEEMIAAMSLITNGNSIQTQHPG